MNIIELDKVDRLIDEPYITWIRDQKLILERPIDVLVKIWSKAYTVYIAMDDDHQPHGIIVCKFGDNCCTTILVYAKNELLKLRDSFYALLKSNGIEKVKTWSHERSEAYERLVGMSHIYSYYEREL